MKSLIINKKIFLVISIIAILLLIVIFFARVYDYHNLSNNGLFTFNPNDLSSKLINFSSQSGNFIILYPEALNAADVPRGNHGDLEVKTIITNFFLSPYVEVAEKSFPEGNIDDAWHWGVQRAKSHDDFQIIAINEYSISNYKGFLHEYLDSIIKGGEKLKYHCLDWYYFRDKTKIGYSFVFCIDQQYWSTTKDLFMKMIGSITFN